MALNDVPLASQTLAATQNPIRQNFSVIDTAFQVDHVAYNAANQGMHAKVSLPVQAMAPAFGAGILGIYTLLNAITGKNEATVHKESGAGTVDVPFTASSLSSVANPPLGSEFWTMLPSGIKLQGGSFTGLNGGVNTVNINQAPPVIPFLNLFTVIVCPFAGGGVDVDFAVRLIDITNTNQFRVYISNRTSTGAAPNGIGGFQFLAIGR